MMKSETKLHILTSFGVNKINAIGWCRHYIYVDILTSFVTAADKR